MTPADAPLQARIARARRLELDTPYVPPPGDALEHHAAGYAKALCSAVFVGGFDAGFAARHMGHFTAPLAARALLGVPHIDHQRRSVSVALPNGLVRTALQVGSQGCVALPPGASDVLFTPCTVRSALPDAAAQEWPMGDRDPSGDAPAGLDAAGLQQAVDAAFDPAAMTAALVITWRGRIIAERYGPGVTRTTPLESWSMGKSLIAALLGLLIADGAYALEDPAPIPQWQAPGDARARIRIADLLNMSSGLRIRAPFDPDYDPDGPYPDHLYLYTGSGSAFAYAATRPLQWPPGAVGRYRNTDPVLASYLVRLAVEQRGGNYLAYPQQALFDRLGIRTMVLDTDACGNFLTQGYVQGSARDWARLANFYLQDGVWNGQRLLPAGYVAFLRTLAPAWAADDNPVYGGFFWLNGDGALPAPRDAFYMSGVAGQRALVVPSHELVIVRLGHSSGEAAAETAFNRCLSLALKAVGAAAAA